MAVKMWSPKGNMPNGDTHIALTSGHTFIIPRDKEGIEIPTRFRKEAIARGCLPVGMEEETDESNSFDRDKVIRESIQKMLESEDPTMFSTDGKPALDKLSALCGFGLSRGEANQVWDKMCRDDDDTTTTSNITSEPIGKKK